MSQTTSTRVATFLGRGIQGFIKTFNYLFQTYSRNVLPR